MEVRIWRGGMKAARDIHVQPGRGLPKGFTWTAHDRVGGRAAERRLRQRRRQAGAVLEALQAIEMFDEVADVDPKIFDPGFSFAPAPDVSEPSTPEEIEAFARDIGRP